MWPDAVRPHHGRRQDGMAAVLAAPWTSRLRCCAVDLSIPNLLRRGMRFIMFIGIEEQDDFDLIVLDCTEASSPDELVPGQSGYEKFRSSYGCHGWKNPTEQLARSMIVCSGLSPLRTVKRLDLRFLLSLYGA